jgi:hypothetical protein
VKVFCCTLIHCFSTVNILTQGIQGLGPIGKERDQRSGFRVETKVDDQRLISMREVTRSDTIKHKGKCVCQWIEVDQLGAGCFSRSAKVTLATAFILDRHEFNSVSLLTLKTVDVRKINRSR